MSSLSKNQQFEISPVNPDGSPAATSDVITGARTQAERARALVDQVGGLEALSNLLDLEAQGRKTAEDKAVAEKASAEDRARKESFARELGVANRKASRDQKRIAALTAAYAALEAGVPEAFVRQGLRSLNLRESKEDRIRRRTAEDKAEQERIQQRRDIKADQKRMAEESRAAMKERNAKLREERLGKKKKRPEKGIPPKVKADPLKLGVDVDADPATAAPAPRQMPEGYDARGNPIQPAPDRDIGTPTVRDRLEAAGISGSKDVGAALGLKFDRDTSQYDQPRPQADMTPIDVDAENRMMMADMLDFGPNPRTVTPQGGALTPSQMLDMGLKDRVGSKAPGYVGSAPIMMDSLGFSVPSGNGFGDPAAEAAARGPERPGLIDRARSKVEDLQRRLRSGQAAQRQMMSGITDEVGTFDIDETLENLQTEFDDLTKKKKVMDLQGKVQGLQKDLAKGQRGSGVPVDHGFRQSFDQNVRQPLRDLLGMND